MQTAALHLCELAEQVRGVTLRMLKDVPVAWQRWAPAGTSNHILWHAGHMLWVQDILAIEPLTGRSELPAGWAETFGGDCRPVLETKDWPSLAEVVARLSDQLPRLVDCFAQADPQKLLDVSAPSRDWNLPRGIIHGLHDEARHQGEIFLLQKMCHRQAKH